MNGRSEKKKTLTIINPNSSERDATKKNKLGRSLEIKMNKRSSNDGGAATKRDSSKPISIQMSHEDIAKVLKTLGGISKSLGYKIPKEYSAKGLRGKKKNVKMKAPDSKELEPGRSLRARNSETDSSSQSTLPQKMAEVLSCVTDKKPLSELNLLGMGTNPATIKNGNVSAPNFPFACNTNTPPPISSTVQDNKRVPTFLGCNKTVIGEKSRSSEYFKYLNLVKQPSRSLSFDKDQSLIADRQDSKLKVSISRNNTSETLIRKVDLTKSRDSCHFRNSPSPFANSLDSIDWGKLGFREPDSISAYSCPREATQGRICPHRTQSGSEQLNPNNGTSSCFSSFLPTNTKGKFCCCDVKSQKRECFNADSKHLLTSVHPPGNENQKLSKISVKVCHCPHLHTESTIKKICFHDCVSPDNMYSSKIFRVNYLSKDERQKGKQNVKSEPNQDAKPAMEDFKTVAPEVLGKREGSTRTARKVVSVDFVDRAISPKKPTLGFKTFEINKLTPKTNLKARKSLSNSKTEKKEKLMKPRTFSEHTRPKVMLWNNENHIQILGGSNPRKETVEKKSSGGTWKGMVDSKSTKMAPQVRESVRRVVRPISKLRGRDPKKVSKDEKALEELAVLEKLFGKLNTMERSLREKKMTEGHHQCGSISKMSLTKKSKGEEESHMSCDQMKSLLKLDTLTDDDCQRRRRKLRSAIIRHVQNWLKLDFDEF